MFVKNLVDKHGLGIKISCGPGYPIVVVLEDLRDGRFKCKNQTTGVNFVLFDIIEDYRLVVDDKATAASNTAEIPPSP